MIDFDVTEYCNAIVDGCKEYCIQKFKKACEREGIMWQSEWEKILYE